MSSPQRYKSPAYASSRSEDAQGNLLSLYADLSLSVPVAVIFALFVGLMIVLFAEPTPIEGEPNSALGASAGEARNQLAQEGL